MSELDFKQGSSACNGEETVFLIAPCSTIGDPIISKAEWFRANKAWIALDDACKEFGNCLILKSCEAVKYDEFCSNH